MFFIHNHFQHCRYASFSDGCSAVKCPSGTNCVNVPGGSVKCRCTKPGHKLENGKCVKQAGKIVKVSGLKLDQTFKESYKDKNSKSFKKKAAEIENVLQIVVCQKIIGCIGISVLSINKGSIVVDYSVMLAKEYNNVTENTVLEVSKKSLDDEQMLGLRVNRTSSLSAQSEFNIIYLLHLVIQLIKSLHVGPS